MCGISPQKAWSNNFSYKKMGWVYFGTTKFENDENQLFFAASSGSATEKY